MNQYKTQVLLLHSEQSTLDEFSSGFDDRYTVHRAMSGAEALTTLGETPIHVIVSAQKLPGMSGAEALREAKKRSPETLGILLAGDSSEALVGEKEVFQVVRGGIEPADLRRLIDNATRQSRLFALAESANDVRADPDEPASEHIIMETSENGSSIITDATGKLPVLDPGKISSSAAVGAAAVDVLVISKDPEFLKTIKESSRGVHTVHYANTLKQAEDAVRKHAVGVAVVDAAMVGENVEKLTVYLRGLRKRLVAIVAGRRDDGEMLMDLINRGKVYRFLLKPVSPGRARLALEASVKHHLEAPDSAFSNAGKAAAVRQTPQKSRSRPEPAVSGDPKPAAARSQAAPVHEAKTREAIAANEDDSPGGAVAGLDDPFAGDSSLSETMTGIVSTVSKSIAGSEKDGESGNEVAPPPLAIAADGGDSSSFLSPKLIGIGAAAIAAVAAIGFWVSGGADQPVTNQPRPTAAISTVEDARSPGGGLGQAPVDIDELLEEARLARDAGQIFNPPGSNAIELYAAAVNADPENAYVAAELDATLDEALGMAETALLEQRPEEAAAALARVRGAKPEHPRLPFLTAQVSQMQLRGYLDSARTAIREDRLEDASSAITDARALGVADAGEIDAVEDELLEARSMRRVDEVLVLANQKLEEGALTSPANDNARYYFQLALSNDPGNAAAQNGLSVVASKIVLQARAEIDRGRFGAAGTLLEEARQLDPESAELVASTRALAEARQRAEQERRAEAERRAAKERAEQQRQAAESEAEQARGAAAAASAAEAGEPAAAEAVAAESPAAEADETNPDEPVVDELPATDTGETAADAPVADESSNSEAAGDAGPEAEPARQAPVAASTLNRKKYVAPRYPRAAERRNISGWVDVLFTVTADGTVAEIEVVGSEPGDTFVDAATRAVEKWEFEPVVEDGQIVEKRAGVRMMFALE
jgi:TonB family protein